MITNAFAYLRVSGPGQEHGDGFPRQRQSVQEYARNHDIEIVQEFRDVAVPGKTEMEDRPGLGALLAALEESGVRTVLVEISDRLARNVVVNEMIIREFQKLGVQVVSASGGVDLTAGTDDNPTAKLVRQILGAVAEFDRCIIVLKTRAARERIRQQTGKCEGRKRFGEIPGEESTLRIILETAAEGQSGEAIANMLEALKIPSRSGKPWRGSVVRKILARNCKGEAT